MPSTGPEHAKWWYGRLAGRPTPPADDSVLTILQETASGCATFQVLTSSGRYFWIKAMGNEQANQALVTERVVGGIGNLLACCVRPTHLIEIPSALDGVLVGSSYRLSAGLAHGSLHLEDAQEVETLKYRNRDHNSQRQAQIYALWDLMLGEDEQWLCDQSDDFSMWSFDHSLWLARSGGDWDETMLHQLVDRPWEARPSPAGLDANEIERLAQALRSLAPRNIVGVLRNVPPEWGTTDRELETLGWFVFRRSRSVADRLDEMMLTV